MNTTPTRRPAALLALAAAAALVLAGCAPTADAEPAAVAPTTAAENVTIADAWVKAADEGMTAAFGELTNTGDTEVSVLASTSAAATMTELHETVDDGSGSMSMQEKEGGFVLPAGGTLVLEPGGLVCSVSVMSSPHDARHDDRREPTRIPSGSCCGPNIAGPHTSLSNPSFGTAPVCGNLKP